MGPQGQLRVPGGRGERELAGRREALDPRLVLPHGLGNAMLSDIGQRKTMVGSHCVRPLGWSQPQRQKVDAGTRGRGRGRGGVGAE